MIEITKNQDGKKYYMFKKDPQGYLGEGLTSQRGPSGLINIITKNSQNVNPEVDLSDLKVGDIFWIGDSIKIEVLQNEYKEEVMDYKKLNERLQQADLTGKDAIWSF